MTMRKRAVAVVQLPVIRNAKQREIFLRDMQSCIDAERPFVVLDCSGVSHLDRPAVSLLLCCLEEAMKRNGDLKLAGLHSSAEAALEALGVIRLFDIHDTTASAMSSFHKIPTNAASHSSRVADHRAQPGSAA